MTTIIFGFSDKVINKIREEKTFFLSSFHCIIQLKEKKNLQKSFFCWIEFSFIIIMNFISSSFMRAKQKSSSEIKYANCNLWTSQNKFILFIGRRTCLVHLFVVSAIFFDDSWLAFLVFWDLFLDFMVYWTLWIFVIDFYDLLKLIFEKCDKMYWAIRIFLIIQLKSENYDSKSRLSRKSLEKMKRIQEKMPGNSKNGQLNLGIVFTRTYWPLAGSTLALSPLPPSQFKALSTL